MRKEIKWIISIDGNERIAIIGNTLFRITTRDKKQGCLLTIQTKKPVMVSSHTFGLISDAVVFVDRYINNPLNVNFIKDFMKGS